MAFSIIKPLFEIGSLVKNKNACVTCVYTGGEKPQMYGNVKNGAQLIKLGANTELLVRECYTVAMDDPEILREECFYAYELVISDPLKTVGVMRISLMESELVAIKPAKVKQNGVDKTKIAKNKMTKAPQPNDFPEVGGEKKSIKDSEPPRVFKDEFKVEGCESKTYKHSNVKKRVRQLCEKYENNAELFWKKLKEYNDKLNNAVLNSKYHWDDHSHINDVVQSGTHTLITIINLKEWSKKV